MDLVIESVRNMVNGVAIAYKVAAIIGVCGILVLLAVKHRNEAQGDEDRDWR